MKALLVCSHGGHLSELQRLLPAFEGHALAWASYHSERTRALAGTPGYERLWLTTNIGASPVRLLAAFPWAWRVLRRERPAVIVSTGAEIAVPFFVLAWVLRIPTVFVETWTRVSRPTLTGRIVYPITALFLVQWPELKARYGRRARYAGRLL